MFSTLLSISSQRCPIENIVLKCKKLNMGEPRATLLLALQPPKTSDVEMAITTLKEVGALTTTVHGVVTRYDGDLTFVGKILESLPINVKLGKLLVLGHAFGCLESCLVIAAALSLKSFFSRSPLDELTAYR
jgi:ATP-dependent RNA helicase TDRD9